MSDFCRCLDLSQLTAALAFHAELVRGAHPPEAIALRARVQTLQGCVLAEELHPRRGSWRWRDPVARPSVLVLHQGHCLVEVSDARARQPLIQAAAGQAIVLASSTHEFTVSQAPCRLLRLLLPAASSVPADALWSADLTLVLPIQRLLEQALHQADAAHARETLAETLLTYVRDRLAAVGCPIILPPSGPAPSDPLQRLEQWLSEHLHQPLQLSDLAAAVSLSPRRLQELCRRAYGLTPMDLLRQRRLQVLARQLQDAAQAHHSLASLMAELQLPESAATRQAFQRHFGCTPSVWRQRQSGQLARHL